MIPSPTPYLPGTNQVIGAGPKPTKKMKRPLGKNEEFVDYKFVTENGETKRKKIIKRTIKMIK